MIDIALLAGSVVSALVPLLATAGEKGLEKAGELAAGTLFDVMKKRVAPPAAKEAMDDLARLPADTDAQAALRLQLRKAMDADPSLAVVLSDLLDKHAVTAGASQTATVTGNQNTVTQIAGSNNTAR